MAPYPLLGNQFVGNPFELRLDENSPFVSTFINGTPQDANDLIAKLVAENNATWEISGNR
jgi:hypothetical protein